MEEAEQDEEVVDMFLISFALASALVGLFFCRLYFFVLCFYSYNIMCEEEGEGTGSGR